MNSLRGAFSQAMDKLATFSRDKVEEDAFRRDPEVIRRWRWIADGAKRYFSGEVRGWEHVPERGPLMVVGNHSGGLLMPDAYVFLSSWWTERLEQPIYMLVHDLIFVIPGFEHLARGAGAVPGRIEIAEALLERGEAVLVYPGGEQEVFRPITKRNRIQFNGHQGFIRVALRSGAPIVPMVSYGAQDVNLFLTNGERLASLLGLDRVRVKILPLVVGPPFGLVPGFIPLLPLPTKITLAFAEPMRWEHLGPQAADDPDRVQRCYDQVVAVMQAQLTKLASERPNPFSRR